MEKCWLLKQKFTDVNVKPRQSKLINDDYYYSLEYWMNKEVEESLTVYLVYVYLSFISDFYDKLASYLIPY